MLGLKSEKLLDLSGTGDLEALLGARMGLLLRHLYPLSWVLSRPEFQPMQVSSGQP